MTKVFSDSAQRPARADAWSVHRRPVASGGVVGQVVPAPGPFAPPLTTEGLSEREAAARRARGWANRSPAESSRSYLQIARENVFTFINNVLFGLGLALVLLGRPSDAIVTVGVALLNVAVSMAQEVRAKRTLDRIALLTRPTATVVREGQARTVAPDDVVVGDVLLVRPGDQVVADGPLVASVVDLDESLLTGEAEPVAKRPGDRLVAGSFCAAGGAVYRAEAVGAASVAGRLGVAARAYRRVLTPLQRELNLIVRAMLLVAASFELLLVVDAVVNDHPLVESVQDAVVVAGIVPIGLFLAVATAYAVGALRLAGWGILAQQANAVESLSRADVLCLDKTGTLTANAFRLHGLSPLGATEAELRDRLGTFVASTSATNRTGEAIARALPRPRRTVRDEVAFSSAYKWSGLAFASGEVLVLGAPEVLQSALPADAALGPLDDWAAQGLRVLLLARAPVGAALRDAVGAPALPPGLSPLGLAALLDAPRPEARETLAGFRAAGIAIKVMSGDHPATVAALARAAGLQPTDPVRSGGDLDGLDDAALDDLVEGTAVFGRVTPEQKARLVRALRRRGHHVAMIGDGVNDVLALKGADLGIAMHGGSQAARAVADLVLLGDSFAPLPRAFAEGQRVRNGMHNILKLFLTRILFTVLLLLATAAVSDAFPFAPKQHAIFSLLTAGIPALALAAWARPGQLPGHGDLRALARFVVPAGVTLALTALAVLVVALVASRAAYLVAHPGADPAAVARHVEAVAQSALTAFAVVCGLLLLVFVEPPTPVWTGGAGLSPDRRPALLALLLLGVYLVALAAPPLRTFFELTPLPPRGYALIAAAAALWAVVVRWTWRSQALERLLQIGPAEADR